MSATCLKYPKTSRFYGWFELRMLSAALGFPSCLLIDCLPSELVKGELGLRSQDLQRLIDQDCFTAALNFSYNMKSGIHNVKTLKKCINLLDCKSLSFTEIKEAKLAFSVYESLDQKGMKLSQRTLLRAFKMCGRAIAPLKLAHRIKHLRAGFAEEGRLQLYEFLDLLPLCEPQDNVLIRDSWAGSTEMIKGNTYKLDNDSSLLGPEDHRVGQHLNQCFLKEEWDYGIISTESRKLTEPSLLPSFWLQQESLVGAQNQTCTQTQSSQEAYSMQNPSRVPLKGSAAKAGLEDSETWTWVVSVPQLKSGHYTPTKIEPILTEYELAKTERMRSALQYDMDTLEERSQWELQWKMGHYLPGREAPAAERPRSGAVSAVQPVKERRAPVQDVFDRLYSGVKRGTSACRQARCTALTLGKRTVPPSTTAVTPIRLTRQLKNKKKF
ncbi:uncharacterized protein [Lepisosteus oculatus]|uniref:uncharacterized protein n=1 Tax=Lepisosteus oculatus TaxID=7918 RepID=UPI0035F50BA0